MHPDSRLLQYVPNHSRVNSLHTGTVISKLKGIFSENGIPEVIILDGGPQLRSEFRGFAQEWGFQHIQSSPYHNQSSGEAERIVRTIKTYNKEASWLHAELLFVLVSMGFPWLHLVSMWKPCGVHVETMWCQCGKYVVSMWTPWTPGNQVMSTWKLHGSTWKLCGDHVVTTWCPCWNHLVFTWKLQFSHGNHVVSRWT